MVEQVNYYENLVKAFRAAKTYKLYPGEYWEFCAGKLLESMYSLDVLLLTSETFWNTIIQSFHWLFFILCSVLLWHFGCLMVTAYTYYICKLQAQLIPLNEEH